MTENAPSRRRPESLTRDWLYTIRYYLAGRRGLLLGAAIIAASGIGLNWNWLVAAGLAPLIIAVLPCAAMCALGICMHKSGGHERSAGQHVKHHDEQT